MYNITFVVLPCLCTGCLLNLLLVVYLAVRSSNCIISVWQWCCHTLYSECWWHCASDSKSDM